MEEMEALMLRQMAEIEQKDESQIMAELAGEQIADMVYIVDTYDRKKRQTVKRAKLSWAGTKEVARSKGNIMLSEPIVTDLEDTIRIMVKATDLLRNFTVFGGCQQPRKMKINEYGKGGEIIGSHLEDDPYCFQKGLSKCQRNALTLCIPADYAARCIARFLGGSKTKQITQEASKEKTPTKSQIKPREEWDKISEDQVGDFPRLEVIIWNLCKLQPAQLYKELGVGSRGDMTIPPWDAFLSLKEQFVPLDIPSGEPTAE